MQQISKLNMHVEIATLFEKDDIVMCDPLTHL